MSSELRPENGSKASQVPAPSQNDVMATMATGQGGGETPAASSTVSSSGSKAGMGRGFLGSTGGILLSRVSGLLRDIFAAAFWGATGVAQAAYNTAFAVPNSLRMILGEGAISSAFVPALAGYLEEDKKQEAWTLACRAITLQFLVLLIPTVLLGALAAVFGWSQWIQDDATRVTMRLLPILMPFSLLICAAAAFAAILNSLNVFFQATAAQAVFNMTMVVSLILLGLGWTNQDETALWLYCGATLLGGFLQLATLVLSCRKYGFRYRWDLNVKDGEVRALCRRIVPVLVGNGLAQLNGLVDKGLGLWLGAAAVGALNYSHRLVYLPVGLFGVAMGQVALPALARAQVKGDAQGIREGLDFALRTVLFLAIPCTAFLMVCGRETITLLFARGAFGDEAIRETTFALLFYLAGLPAFCCVKVATNPFHARKDTVTPMRISMLLLLANLILNLVLMQFLRQGGLALATSLCSWANVVTLLLLNRKYLPQWTFGPFLKSLAGFLLASAGASAAAWGLLLGLQRLSLLEHLPRTAATAVIVLLALALFGIVYLALCALLGRPEPREFLQAVQRIGKRFHR